MRETKLAVIDGETLMDMRLPPTRFCVQTLLPQGVTVLGGAPKIGKSWLALWLSVMVAKGEPVWGMPVKQGTTLYLCLEDSTLRIQNRLFEITEDAPANVHFTTQSNILGKGPEEQFCTFLTEHPDTVLVIIDTLQMIRVTNYDKEYAEAQATVRTVNADAHYLELLKEEEERTETGKKLCKEWGARWFEEYKQLLYWRDIDRQVYESHFKTLDV